MEQLKEGLQDHSAIELTKAVRDNMTLAVKRSLASIPSRHAIPLLLDVNHSL